MTGRPTRQVWQAGYAFLILLICACMLNGACAAVVEREASDGGRTSPSDLEARGSGLVLDLRKEARAADEELLATLTSAGYNETNSTSQSETVINATTTTTAVSVPAISTNGTVNSYALSCFSARYTWWMGYDDFYSSSIEGTSFSSTVYNTTTQIPTTATVTIYPSSVSTYKLCDGSPRANAVPLTITSSYNYTSTFETVETPGLPTYTPAPCTESSVDCEYLYYNTDIADNSSSNEYIVLLGACGSPAHLGAPCLIGGGPVRLAYFPVTTTDGDLCLGNGSTITSMSGPTVVDALGTTLTSGSVYLSFQTLYAYQDGFGNRIGPNFTDFLLPLPSSAISTQCGGWFSAQGPGTAVNWADFNYPVPASAYNCANRCTTELSYVVVNGSGESYTPPPQCYTIWDDFNPALAVPSEARALVPEWSTCSFWDEDLPNFLFDPPIALQPATAVATATLPGTAEATTTSAKPASTSYTALAQTAAQRTASVQSVTITFVAGSATFTATAATGTAEHDAFAVDGVTVTVGGAAETVSGYTISAGLSDFVVDGTTAVTFYSGSAGQVVASAGAGTASSSSAHDSVSSSSSTSGGKSMTSSGSTTAVSSRTSSSHTTSSTSATTATKKSGAAVCCVRSDAIWLTALMAVMIMAIS